MGFTYGQLLAQQRQHFTKIINILEGKAFASTWAHSGQVVRYLFAKLVEAENRESLAIAPEAWSLHAGEAVRNVVAEEASHREDFPYEAFTDFLGNIAQEKFLLPIMLRNNHFAGLCIEKKFSAGESSSNAAIMLELQYVDPKGSAIEPENSNKDLAEIKTKIAEILHECCEVNPALQNRNYQTGNEYNFSCEQQITDCDCAYITAQNLLDFAAGRSEFTCPNYQADPEMAIAEIARLRGEFVAPEIMGAGNVIDYLAQEMLDMLKDQRYDKVSYYIKATSIEQFHESGYGDLAELFHQLKMLFEEQVEERGFRDYLKEHQDECLALLVQLESKLMVPVLPESISTQSDLNSLILPAQGNSKATEITAANRDPKPVQEPVRVDSPKIDNGIDITEYVAELEAEEESEAAEDNIAAEIRLAAYNPFNSVFPGEQMGITSFAVEPLEQLIEFLNRENILAELLADCGIALADGLEDGGDQLATGSTVQIVTYLTQALDFRTISKIYARGKLEQLHYQRITEEIIVKHKDEAEKIKQLLECSIIPETIEQVTITAALKLIKQSIKTANQESKRESNSGYDISKYAIVLTITNIQPGIDEVEGIIDWLEEEIITGELATEDLIEDIEVVGKVVRILPEQIDRQKLRELLADYQESEKLEIIRHIQNSVDQEQVKVGSDEKLEMLKELLFILEPKTEGQFYELVNHISDYSCKLKLGERTTTIDQAEAISIIESDEPILYQAVKAGEYQLVQLYLAAGVDANARYHDQAPNNILTLACQQLNNLLVDRNKYSELQQAEEQQYQQLETEIQNYQSIIEEILYYGGHVRILNEMYSQQQLSQKIIDVGKHLLDAKVQKLDHKIAGELQKQETRVSVSLNELREDFSNKTNELTHKLERIGDIPQQQWQEWQDQAENRVLLANAVQQQLDKHNIDPVQSEYQELIKQYEHIYSTFYKLLAGQLHSKLAGINGLASELLLPKMKQPFLVKVAKILLPGGENIANILGHVQMVKIITESQKKILHIYSNAIEDKVIADYSVRVIEFLGDQIITDISGDNQGIFAKIAKFSQKLARLGQEPRAAIELKQHWQQLSQKYTNEFIIKLAELATENQPSTELGQIIAEEVISKWHQLSLTPVLEPSSTHLLHNAALMASISELVYQDPRIIKRVIQDQWQQPYYQLVGIKDEMRSIVFGDEKTLIAAFKDEAGFKHTIGNGDRKQVITIQGQELEVHQSLYHATEQLWEGVRVTYNEAQLQFQQIPAQEQSQLQAQPQMQLYAIKRFLVTYFAREETDQTSTKLFFTGHSSGGAMANIAALLTMDEFNIRQGQLEIYSYGQPKWCSQKSAPKVQAILGNQSVRFNQAEDMMPSLPPKAWGYAHPQGEYQLSSKAITNPTTTKATITFQKSQDAQGNFISGVMNITKGIIKQLPSLFITNEAEWFSNLSGTISKTHSKKSYADSLYYQSQQGQTIEHEFAEDPTKARGAIEGQKLSEEPSEGKALALTEDPLEAVSEAALEPSEEVIAELEQLSPNQLNERVWQAIEKNEIEVVKYCLKNLTPDINYQKWSNTFLHEAVRLNLGEITTELLKAGADLNKPNSSEETAIDLAINTYKSVALQVLIDFDATIINRLTELEQLIITDKYEELKEKITQNPEILEQVDKARFLNWAAVSNNERITKYFIEELEFDVNQADQSTYRFTPLNRAAFLGLKNMVEYLVDKGADVNEELPDVRTTLYVAVQNGHLEVVKLLVEKGVDIDKADKGGVTPLYGAAQNGHLEVVEKLLNAGADIFALTNSARNILWGAADGGNAKIVEMILQRNCDNINLEDSDGWTPLYVAAQRGHFEAVKYLIEFGADVHITNNNGATPLKIAAQNGYLEVVDLLINTGSEIDKANNNGVTPLLVAAQNGHLEVVKCLVKHGATVDQATNDGATPLHIAAQNDHLVVVQWLLEHGADINKLNSNNNTPLGCCIAKGNYEIAKFLVINKANIDLLAKSDNLDLIVENFSVFIDYVGMENSLLSLKLGLSFIKFNHVLFNKREEPSSQLIKEPSFANTIENAVFDNNINYLKQLVQEGTDINDLTCMERFPLILYAVILDQFDIVKFLLENGADVNVVENNGLTPLWYAILSDNLEIFKLLTIWGAKLNRDIEVFQLALEVESTNIVQFMVENKSDQAATPLYVAAAGGDLDVVRELLEHGADVNQATKDGRTPLSIAAMNGHLEVVQWLVEHGATVDQSNNNGSTSLYVAAQNGHLEVVQWLLEHGANINRATNNGYTPLYVAAEQGHLAAVQWLAEHGADINQTANNGATPLHAAAVSGHSEVVQCLVEKGANLNTAEAIGRTPLWAATAEGDLEVVRELLLHKATVDQANNNGFTPLYVAAQNGHSAVVRELLEHEAAINQGNNDGATPLYIAAQNGHLEVVRILLEHDISVDQATNDGATPLHIAAQQGHLEVVQWLAEHGADINQARKDGATPLLVVAEKGDLEVVKCLVEHRADVNQATNNGTTPLHNAVQKGQLHIVQFLVEQGAELEKVDEWGETPIFDAVRNGELEIVKYLKDKGADIAISNNKGETLLYMAVQERNTDMILWLAENAVNIDEAANDGKTPLFLAVNNGDFELMQLLLSLGADVDRVDNGGRTPLWSVAFNGNLIVAQCLVDQNADLDKPNNNGATPLYVAAQNGHLGVVQLLIGSGASVDKASNNKVAPLYIAAYNGHLEVVQFLLEHGAEIEQAKNDGATPLWIAAQEGHLEVVRFLVLNGAEIDKAINRGSSPLFVAARGGHLEVVKLLAENGADIDKANNHNSTALLIAAEKGYFEIVRYLVGNGADINKHDNDEDTSLKCAAMNGHLDVVQFLAEHGAAIDIVDKKGYQPLHIAAQNGHLPVIEFLLLNGADVNAVDNKGNSVLMIAIRQNHLEAVKMLLESGAEVNYISEQGKTALYHAIKNNSSDIIEILLEYQVNVRLEDLIRCQDKELKASLVYNHLINNYDARKLVHFFEECYTEPLLLKYIQLIAADNMANELFKNVLQSTAVNNPNLINLQNLYLLTLYYDNDFKQIMDYLNHGDVDLLANFSLKNIFHSWALVKLQKPDNSLKQQLDEIDEFAKESEESGFYLPLYHYIRAEYYLKAQQYDLALKALEEIEELEELEGITANLLISPMLLREYINFEMGNINYDLDFEALRSNCVTASDKELVTELQQRMQVRINIKNARERLEAYNELQEQLGDSISKLIVNSEATRFKDISEILLKAEIKNSEVAELLDLKYGYELLDSNSIQINWGKVYFRGNLFQNIHLKISALRIYQNSLIQSFKDIITRLENSEQEEFAEHSYLHKLYALFKELRHTENYNIAKIDKILVSTKDQQLKELALELLDTHSSILFLKHYYMAYINKFCEIYGTEAIGIFTGRDPDQALKKIATMVVGNKPIEGIDPEKSGITRESGAEKYYVTTDTALGDRYTNKAIGRIQGFLVKELNGINIENKFALENVVSDVDAGRHQIIILEDILPAEYDAEGQEMQSKWSLHLKRNPYSSGMEFVVNSLQRQLDPENALPNKLIKLESVKNYLQTTYFLVTPTIQGTRLDELLREKDFIEKINAENFSSAFITSTLAGMGDGKPDNVMVRHYNNPVTGKDEVKLIFVDSDMSFTQDQLKHILGKDGYKKFYSEMLNVLLFFPQMKDPLAPEVVATLTETNYVAESIVVKWLADIYEQNQNYAAMLENGWDELDFELLKLPICLPAHTGVKTYMRLKKICDMLRHNKEVSHHKIFKLFYPAVSIYYQALEKSNPLESIENLYRQVYRAITEDSEELQHLYNKSIIDYGTLSKTITKSKVPSDQAYHKIFSVKIEDIIAEFIAAIDFSSLADDFMIDLIQSFYFLESMSLHNVSKGQLVQMFRTMAEMEASFEIKSCLKHVVIVSNAETREDRKRINNIKNDMDLQGSKEKGKQGMFAQHGVSLEYREFEYDSYNVRNYEMLNRARLESDHNEELTFAQFERQYDNIMTHLNEANLTMLARGVAIFEKNIKYYHKHHPKISQEEAAEDRDYTKLLFTEEQVAEFALQLIEQPMLAGIAELLIARGLLTNKIVVNLDDSKAAERSEGEEGVEDGEGGEGTKGSKANKAISLLPTILMNERYDRGEKQQLIAAIIRKDPESVKDKEEEKSEGENQGNSAIELAIADGEYELAATMINAVAGHGYNVAKAIMDQAIAATTTTVAQKFMIAGALRGLEVTAQELRSGRYDHSKKTKENETILHLLLQTGDIALFKAAFEDLEVWLTAEKGQEIEHNQGEAVAEAEQAEQATIATKVQQELATIIWAKHQDYDFQAEEGEAGAVEAKAKEFKSKSKELPKANLWDLAEEARAGELLAQLYENYGGEAREELSYIAEVGAGRLARDNDKQKTAEIAQYYELVNWPLSIEEAVGGIDVNKLNYRGQTILHEVMLKANYEIEAKLGKGVSKGGIVAKLLKAGANPEVTARADGWTALDLAVKTEQLYLVKLLIAHISEQEESGQELGQKLSYERLENLAKIMTGYETNEQAIKRELFGRKLTEAETRQEIRDLRAKIEEMEEKLVEGELAMREQLAEVSIKVDVTRVLAQGDTEFRNAAEEEPAEPPMSGDAAQFQQHDH